MANTKSQKYDKAKNGVLKYAKMRYYYDLDGDKYIYGQVKLVYNMTLELHYNPPGGFDNYFPKFEEIFNTQEVCDQGLTKSQKRTFFLN